MELTRVRSNAVRAVGYDAATRTMRVAFRNGRTYDYLDVTDPAPHHTGGSAAHGRPISG